MKLRVVLAFLSFNIFFINISFSITLEEAIKRGLEGSYVLKEQEDIIRSSRFSYIATIDPYLPRFDVQSSYIRSIGSGTTVSNYSILNSEDLERSRDAFNFTSIISYRVFDGGERYAKRKGAYSLLERERERFRGLREDVLFNIKSAFYMALGSKIIIEKRKQAFDSAEKIYKLTLGRYEEGVAKKSDVLQSEVRMTSARIELLKAEKEYEKALDEFKSLIFIRPDENGDAEGILKEPIFYGSYDNLFENALRSKPEILLQGKEVERLMMVYRERKSTWFPKIDTELRQTRQDRRFFPDGRSDAFIVNFTFPLFDGIGRYYNVKGAASDIQAAKQKLEEIKRSVKLDIEKAIVDYELSMKNVKLYTELVREAMTNFNQLYGEYKVGKGDIVALLQSEKDLASAMENQIVSIYKANISLAYLEKVAYLNR